MTDTTELRAYTQAEVDALGAKGQAFKNPDGHFSFPIANRTDVVNAIHAIGRSNLADKAPLRRFIIARAKALNASRLIPDNWNSDGSTKRSADEALDGSERRRQRAGELDGALEVRHFDAQNVEIRELSDGMFRFSGYASITEYPYDMGSFTETISRGAFKRTLGEHPDVALLINHSGLPLARTKSGTMTLAEDSRGLLVDADLNPHDPDVRSIVPKMQRGDVDQMSFGFRVTDQEWNADHSQRTIRSVALHRGDVSIVTHGANPATSSVLTARSAGRGRSARAASPVLDYTTGARAWLDRELAGGGVRPTPARRSRPSARRSDDRQWLERELRRYR